MWILNCGREEEITWKQSKRKSVTWKAKNRRKESKG